MWKVQLEGPSLRSAAQVSICDSLKINWTPSCKRWKLLDGPRIWRPGSAWLFSFTKNLMVILQRKRFCHHSSSLIWMRSNAALEARAISSTGQYGVVLTTPIIIMVGHLACPRAVSSGKHLLRSVHFYTTFRLCPVCVGNCDAVCVAVRPCCIFP